jgi:hypothetical protein
MTFQTKFRPPFALACALLFTAGSIYAHAANFYINANGAQGDGSGSSPDNAADASPGKYNALVIAQKTPGTVIVYAPGAYVLWPALPMYNGVTHQGSGIDSTVIKIADGAAEGDFAPMYLAGGGTISNFKFTDATIDFNSDQTAWWKKGRGKCIAFAFSLADHCTIQRVKFIHLGEKNLESFPVFFNVGGSAPGHMNHNLVDSCIFTQPIKSGNTKEGGLTCIQMADALPDITTDTTNVVSNNQFLDLKAPEFSDFGYTQCASAPVVEKNTASGIDSLWFVEPGSAHPGPGSTFDHVTVQVKDNTLTNCGQVAFILMHPNGAFGGNLEVENNTDTLAEAPYLRQGPSKPCGFAVATFWPGNSSVGNILIKGNTFIAPTPLVGTPAAIAVNPVAPNLFTVASLAVLNNTYVNFPQEGSENNITHDPAYNPNFTESGNVHAK